jgi:ribosomal protein S21
MGAEVKKEENESSGSMLYRFNRRVQQSGVLKEFKKRRFRSRTQNKNQRRASALRREAKRIEVESAKKLGKL